MGKVIFILTLFVLAGFFFSRCDQGSNGNNTGALHSASAVNYTFDIVFKDLPPYELAENATPEQKVSFAWNEFLSINWKCASLGPPDYLRGTADTKWSYSTDSKPYPDLMVWESYAHRSELRPFDGKIQLFTNNPHYSFGIKPVPYPGAMGAGARFDLFDNLDENNEIGSCNLYGRVDVFGKGNQVLYQAKCNEAEYDYIRKTYPTQMGITTATTNTRNNITLDSAYYPGAPLVQCGYPASQDVICLPCQNGLYNGAMEVKTAWRRLAPDEDSTKFLTRKVIVYAKGDHNEVYFYNATYAMIGLHIIHKTKNYPNFVFATWEHVDVEKHHMGYVLLDTTAGNAGNEVGPIHTDYPRLHPIPAVVDSGTAYVHRLLAQMNKNSVWQYYRLVGVQTTPTNDSTSFSYFMANYVIESDPILADFHGSGIKTPFDGRANSLYMGHGYTMGGCQGCHGVAQTKLGGDQSFLMDNFGKPVDTPDVARSGSKLLRYIHGIEKINREQQALLARKHQ